MKLGKKANIFDVVTSFRSMVILLFAVLLIGTILFNFSTEFEKTDFGNSTEQESANDFMQNFGATWDWGFLVIFIVLMIASVIFARLIPSNTVFFITGIFATPLIGLAIIVFDEIAQMFMSQAQFSTALAQMPITSFMFDYTLILGIIYIFVVYIAMFVGKNE